MDYQGVQLFDLPFFVFAVRINDISFIPFGTAVARVIAVFAVEACTTFLAVNEVR